MKEPKKAPPQLPSKITEIRVDIYTETEGQGHFNQVSIQVAFIP